MLIGILVIAASAIWVALPSNPGIHTTFLGQQINLDFSIHEGLDLQGGVQVLLEADVPPGTQLSADSLQAARQIVERRINALGVVEPLIQQGEGNRIIVELPGVKNPDQAVKTFGSTGLLEFIDAGSTPLAEGTMVTTSLGGPSTTDAGNPTPTAAAPATVYRTIIQGKDLKSADVTFDQMNKPQIAFVLNDEGAKAFADYSTANVGKYLAISLDKRIISSPVIESPITEGRGVIQGRFTIAEAKDLTIQLKYGALPVPLKIMQSRSIGPTLGEDSLQKSLTAGIIGLGIVALFMLVYYRLPGLLADLALVIYTAVVFSLFKLIPVTLTLAGIAGFILSIGMAVDANILIFERMKEELRAGRSLRSAIDVGFARAWTSIRDSNMSTIITCAILFWFGMSFGASIIQGFALTLFIGVVVSMFTAILVSRTFLQLLVESGLVKDLRWYGLYEATPSAKPAQKPA
jgi:preprotein translocase subunit SecD